MRGTNTDKAITSTVPILQGSEYLVVRGLDWLVLAWPLALSVSDIVTRIAARTDGAVILIRLMI